MTDVVTRIAAAVADRYRIERELGQGGMATVYLAQDLRHDRRVAVKVLRPELAAVIGADRFLSEIKTTANLQHPHILPLFDSGTADGFLFYVMPYVDGESLRDRLSREKQLPIADAVRIAKEVSSALDYAHRRGIIHRDIKPENVMLQDGSALVADFGIALAASRAGSTRMTETGMSLGTPSYMSPEQAMGEREITPRSDVYALGAMTYEMLVGDPPFIGSTAQAIVAKVLTEKPAPPSAARETVPDAVEDAVLTALAKLPADRWPSAAAFSAALDRPSGATRARATTARGSTRAMPVTPRRMRAPWPWVAALLAALVLAAVGWLRHRPSPPAPVIRMELEPGVGGAIAMPLDGVATQLALSPDGSMAVFVAQLPGGGWSLSLRNLDRLASRPLPGTEGGLNPEFSPDNHWIAFRSSDGKLRKIAVDGTSLTTLCTIDDGGLIGAGLTWISNREIVFTRGAYATVGGLWRVSSDGGDPVPFSHFDRKTGERLQLSPRAADGGRLVFYSSTIASNADLRLGVVKVATGESTVFSGLRAARVAGLIDGYLIYVRGDGALMAAPFDTRTLRPGAPLQIMDSVAVPPSAWNVPVALSASGSLLVQRGGNRRQLVSVDPHGTTRVLLDSAQVYLHPRLSPDGRRIAVEVQTATGADIWISDLTEHTTERLTRDGYNNRPEWTPDGRSVLYTSTRPPGDALWLQPADGSADAAMLYHATDPIREGVFIPDGRGILFRVDNPTRSRDIYLLPLAGDRKPQPFLVNPNDDKQPRPSPDSKWVAYVSNESGREEVYVRALAASGGRVMVSAGGGGEPLWSPDSRRIYYRVGGRLMAATIATSPALTVTARDSVLAVPFATDIYHPNYDVAPDGQSFVMVRPVVEDRHVVLVVNWIEELRRRTGAGR